MPVSKLHPNLARRRKRCRGFSICLTRHHPKAKTTKRMNSTEWVGPFDIDEVEAEARFLANDPRDTITEAIVWDDKRQQFCLTVRPDPIAEQAAA